MREILVYGKIPKWMLLVIVCFLHIIFQNEIDVVILSRRERNNFTLFLWNKLSHNLQIYVDQMHKCVLMMLLFLLFQDHTQLQYFTRCPSKTRSY